MIIDDLTKNTYGLKVAGTLAQALEDGKITTEEGAKASAYIMEKFKDVSTQALYVAMLIDLASKWDIFMDLLILEKGKLEEDFTKQKQAQVLSEIQGTAPAPTPLSSVPTPPVTLPQHTEGTENG